MGFFTDVVAGPVFLIGILIAGLIVVGAVFFIGNLALIYCEGYHYDKPLLTKTVVVEKFVEGVPMHRNPRFVDSDGDGYIVVSLTGIDVRLHEKYAIKYFCGEDDNLRKVVSATYIVPVPTPLPPTPIPTPDPALCRTVNGVCE